MTEYNYFRDYDASTGRYVESDPIGLRGGANTYGYVDQWPVQSIDPSGRYSWPMNIHGAKADVFDYIERFYNPRRRHSTLGYLSPVDYEKSTSAG